VRLNRNVFVPLGVSCGTITSEPPLVLRIQMGECKGELCMEGRAMVRRTRIGSIILAGGLIAGMSVFASEVAPHDSVVLVSQDTDDQIQKSLGSLLSRNFSNCPRGIEAAKNLPTRMGTPGAGLNCGATWRVECGSEF
jgi:hypothetical protein